jgi:hypothetical protein
MSGFIHSAGDHPVLAAEDRLMNLPGGWPPAGWHNVAPVRGPEIGQRSGKFDRDHQ